MSVKKTMMSQGVRVTIEHEKLGLSKGSGLLINNSIVIVHGSIIASLCYSQNYTKEFLYQYNCIINKMRSFFMSPNQNNGHRESCGVKFKVTSNTRTLKLVDSTQKIIKYSELPSEHYTVREGIVLFIYKNKDLLTDMNEIPDCLFSDSIDDKDVNLLFKDAMSLFIFLSLDEESESCCQQTLCRMYDSVKNTLLYPGLELVVESTPFGNKWFCNSWSRGVISKLLGAKRDGLLLTDARLVNGCEGAPIYLFANGVKGALVGIVIQTISFCNGEWVGFSLGITMKNLLGTILGFQTNSIHDYIPFSRLQIDQPSTELNLVKIASSIVFVRCKNKWGSGVLIDSKMGIIITCSHIIDHDHSAVSVVCAEGKVTASVIYATPLSGAYDLAVLSVGPGFKLKQLLLAQTPPNIGERVFACGYPLTRESLVSVDGYPTVSAGCVSRLSRRGGPLQTTCCTQSGLSGGAIVRPPDQLLGIVVSNARIHSDRSPLSSFSFAVSVEDFRKPIAKFLETKDPSYLKSLSINKTEALQEWLLSDCKL